MMVRKSKGIGERHKKILDFIASYQREHKHPAADSNCHPNPNADRSHRPSRYRTHGRGFLLPARKRDRT